MDAFAVIAAITAVLVLGIYKETAPAVAARTVPKK